MIDFGFLVENYLFEMAMEPTAFSEGVVSIRESGDACVINGRDQGSKLRVIILPTSDR